MNAKIASESRTDTVSRRLKKAQSCAEFVLRLASCEDPFVLTIFHAVRRFLFSQADIPKLYRDNLWHSKQAEFLSNGGTHLDDSVANLVSQIASIFIVLLFVFHGSSMQSSIYVSMSIRL